MLPSATCNYEYCPVPSVSLWTAYWYYFNVNILVKFVNVIFLCFQPPAKGAFLRGSGMDQSTGRFTAPIAGIYQFSANVHIGKSLQHTFLCTLSQCGSKRPPSLQHLLDWCHFFFTLFAVHSVLPNKVNVWICSNAKQKSESISHNHVDKHHKQIESVITSEPHKTTTSLITSQRLPFK